MNVGRIAGAFAAMLAMGCASGANAADVRERSYVVRKGEVERSSSLYLGTLPTCSDQRVERWIAATFRQREERFWHSGLLLSSFTSPREIGFNSWGPDFIPRRFCSANVTTTDGRSRQIYWNLALGLGRWTLGPGIDWCVTGLDRNYAYAPDCKMARP